MRDWEVESCNKSAGMTCSGRKVFGLFIFWFLLWLVFLSCSFGLASMPFLFIPSLGFTLRARAKNQALVKNRSLRFFRCQSLALRAYFFKRRKSSQKVAFAAFAAILPCGLLRNFPNYFSNRPAQIAHPCALRFPRIHALQPVAEMILKTV